MTTPAAPGTPVSDNVEQGLAWIAANLLARTVPREAVLAPGDALRTFLAGRPPLPPMEPRDQQTYVEFLHDPSALPELAAMFPANTHRVAPLLLEYNLAGPDLNSPAPWETRRAERGALYAHALEPITRALQDQLTSPGVCLELLMTARPAFVTGDHPVVVGNGDRALSGTETLRVLREHEPRDWVYLPLGPTLAALWSRDREPRWRAAPADEVGRLNQRVAAQARRFRFARDKGDFAAAG